MLFRSVQLGDAGPVDTSLFQQVIKIKMQGRTMELGPILGGEFNVVFYTDIGMDLESKYLSNLRIAPIQIAGYGHPVSTFGSTVDYFLAGAAVENQNAKQHYSERIVLIEGLGIHPTIQKIKTPQAKNKMSNDEVLIN